MKKKDVLKMRNGKEIDIAMMTRAVNEFDKDFGIKLKSPHNAEKHRKVAIERAKINLSAMMTIVNGVDIRRYFDITTLARIPTKVVSTESPEFCEDSLLFMDTKYRTFDTDTIVFRCRFVSFVLESLMNNFKKIIKNQVVDEKHSQDEKAVVCVYNNMKYATRFSSVIIGCKEYRNILLKMHEIISYKYSNKNQDYLKNYLVNEIMLCIDSMKSTVFTERFYSDDMCVYSLLRIAYMLATNDTKCKGLPNFKHIEGATFDHDMIKLIEKLGREIHKTNGAGKYPAMFLAFLKSRPKIYNQFTKESKENYFISVGIVALGYAAFVMNDKNIDNAVEKILSKGK